MLIASEGYGFAPMALGAPTALSREESQGLAEITDKATVIDHLTRGFAVRARDDRGHRPVGPRQLALDVRRERSTPELMMFVAGDMHEHLGQLIAYARTNRIVPPWSR